MSERRLELVYDSLADASSDVRNAMDNGYELVGTWSLAEILQHLNLTMRMTLEGPAFQASALMRPVYRILFMPMIKKGRPVKIRATAPKSLTPANDLDENACADRFHELVARLSDPTTEFQPFHPLMGNLNREQWLLMQKWHAAHHLSFMVPTS